MFSLTSSTQSQHGIHILQFIVETYENSYEKIINALKEWNSQKT